MIGVLDPAGPWVWLLYTLAGAGFTVWSVSEVLRVAPPLERDMFHARPAARATLAVICWAVWPLLAAFLVACKLLDVAYWLWDYTQRVARLWRDK